MTRRIINTRPSTIETVDSALFNWLTKELKLGTTTNKGFKETPVLWISAERAFHVKMNQELREIRADSIVLPVITVERTIVDKTSADKRPIPANVRPVNDFRGGAITFAKRINQVKTRNFANADARRVHGQYNFPYKIVYQHVSIPYPVYLDMTYKIKLRTEYLQQLNELLTPFHTVTGGINRIIIKHDGFRYEAFIEPSSSLEVNAASLGEAEKKYSSDITVKVLGFVSSDGENQVKPNVVIRENTVQLRFQRERVIVGDENILNSNDEPFRS